MTLNLITVDMVKTQLGIAVSTYDSALTALLPIVSADVRRILNNQFSKVYGATITSGSASATFSDCPDIGTLIDSPYTALGTYISAYNPMTGVYTLSANATGSGSYCHFTISLAQVPTISKMIWYKYSKQNTTSASERKVSSIS